MRRLSAAMVAITAAIALVGLAAPAWAKPKPQSKTLAVSPTEVKSGQLVKVSGGGCQGITVLEFLIDGKEFHRGNTRSGDFTYQVKLPTSLKSGSHEMGAECRGSKHKPARFHVKKKSSKDKDDDDKEKGKDKGKSKRSFNVSPDVVTAGDKVWAEGTGCKRHASVKIRLNGKTIKRTHADKHGTFDKGVRIPKGTKKGRHVVSAKCGGRHLGSDGVKVNKVYRQHPDGTYTWGTVVEAGKKLKVRGDDCPDGLPVASLDEAPVALNVVSKSKGFEAEATIPAGTAPGNHKFYAGCDAGSSSTQELNVLDPEDTDTAASRQALGPQPTSDLAMWAGLFAGLALLVTSVLLTTRRRNRV